MAELKFRSPIKEETVPDHLGLKFDKFVWWENDKPVKDKRVKDKRNNTKSNFTRLEEASLSAFRTALMACQQRQKARLQGVGVLALRLQAAAPLTLGLGSEHVLETGFDFHRTYGVPYARGSALKGLARAWAELNEQLKTREFMKVFGYQGQSFDEQGKRIEKTNKNLPKEDDAGEVVFWDAFPEPGAELEADTMTVHFPTYYRGTSLPLTSDQVNPVGFLRVKAGSVWNFTLSTRLPRAVNHEDVEALKRAWEWLKQGLIQLGLGAKTAAGYGWFKTEEPGAGPAIASPAAAKELKNSMPVRCEILAEKDRQGRPKLKELSSGRVGGFKPGLLLPEGLQAGDVIQLFIDSVSSQEIRFTTQQPNTGPKGNGRNYGGYNKGKR